MSGYLLRGTATDPWYNLALEETLLDLAPPGGTILYLWQNQRTVVIGKNQNPWKECRLSLLEQEGGKLARRCTGGGAVFHDLGNLNFSFVCREADYDVRKQLSVILGACRALGIPAEISGRNDLLADGRKFSGSAFLHREGKALHHGTLMVAVDTALVSRYLSPSKAKLAAKGVDSVRSRVVNLNTFVPRLTCESLSERLIAAFSQVYGPWQPLFAEAVDPARVEALRQRNASRQWRLGSARPFTLTWEDRFSWGTAELCLSVAQGQVTEARLYTDALDPALAPAAEQALTGVPLELPALETALAAALPAPVGADLAGLLRAGL